MRGAHRVYRNPYSLMSSPNELDNYQISVLRVDPSRGGSAFMHEQVRVGSELEIAHPVNLFGLAKLARKHLLLEKSGFGSRVPKYQQRFCNTEFSVFQFTPQERAIICELLLRGPQTPGELRSRAARMAEFIPTWPWWYAATGTW